MDALLRLKDKQRSVSRVFIRYGLLSGHSLTSGREETGKVVTNFTFDRPYIYGP